MDRADTGTTKAGPPSKCVWGAQQWLAIGAASWFGNTGDRVRCRQNLIHVLYSQAGAKVPWEFSSGFCSRPADLVGTRCRPALQ